MKTRVFLLLSAVLMAATMQAQSFQTDAQRLQLKGSNVQSVLETTRNSHNQVVGQPIRYIFNEQGNYEHVHYFDTAGTLAITVHYLYDKKGRLSTDNRLLEPFSKLDGVTNYSYDKKRRQLTAELLQIEDTTSFVTIYSYNKAGQEVEVLMKDGHGDTIGRVEKQYDGWGNMVSTTYFQGKDNLYRGEIIYRYDTDGNVVEENNMDLNRVSWALLYSYSFDEHGNWTKCYKFRVTTTAASLYEVVTRTINYRE